MDVLVSKKDVLTHLGNRNIIDNVPDISLQNLQVSYGGRAKPFVFKNYFLIHRLRKKELPYVIYTEHELGKIHRSFGHLSIKSMTDLLENSSDVNRCDNGTRRSIKNIREDCYVCKMTEGPPTRLKLTIGTEGLRSNDNFQIDTMIIGNIPVPHVVDKATDFYAVAFLRNQITAEI